MSAKRQGLRPDLMHSKPSTNPTAVAEPRMVQEAAPTAAPSQPEAAAPAPIRTEPVAVSAKVPKVEPAQATQPVAITAPIHPRSMKSRSSQMSVQVDSERFVRVSLARVHTGLTGQQILSEALDFWLAHNEF
jgi:hypothetical protein